MERFKDFTTHRKFKLFTRNFKIPEETEGFYSETDFTLNSYTEGERMSNWRVKVARGSQATTNFVGLEQRIYASPGYHIYEFETHPNNHLYRERSGDTCILGFPALSSFSQLEQAENSARESFYDAYRRASTLFSSGVAIGEASRTIQMLRSPGKSLRKRVTQLYEKVLKTRARPRRRVKRRVSSQRHNAQVTKDIAQTWLEGSFGWKPLINDITNGLIAANELSDRQARDKIPLRGFGQVVDSTIQQDAILGGSGGLKYSYSNMKTYKAIVIYRGAITSVSQTSHNSPAHLLGFDPRDIVPTVWELVPYSFLIDYFTNIGKVIDAVSMRRVRLGWGARSEVRVGIYQSVDPRSLNTYYPDNPLFKIYTEAFAPASWRSYNKTVARTPINSVPIPDLRFQVPNSSTKWLNIGALVALRSANHTINKPR